LFIAVVLVGNYCSLYDGKVPVHDVRW